MGSLGPKACIFTAGGTPNPYSPQELSSNCGTPRVLIVGNMNSDAGGFDITTHIVSICARSAIEVITEYYHLHFAIANSLQTGYRHKLVTVTGAISGFNSY